MHMVKVYGSTYSGYMWIIFNEDYTNFISLRQWCLYAQLKNGYIEADRTNHISPKFLCVHEFQKNGDIKICQIQSSKKISRCIHYSIADHDIHKDDLQYWDALV